MGRELCYAPAHQVTDITLKGWKCKGPVPPISFYSIAVVHARQQNKTRHSYISSSVNEVFNVFGQKYSHSRNSLSFDTI